MIGEAIVVVAGSLFVFCSYFEFRQRAGYILYHVVLMFVSSTRFLKWTDELDSLKFRPSCTPGVTIGALLVPMVITSQLCMLKNRTTENSTHHIEALEYYLLASQLMGMSVVCILLLLNKSRRSLSWMLLLVVTVSMSATMNLQSEDSIIWLLLLIIIYILLLLFVLWLFPKSFSLGEAMLLVQACLLLTIDSWTSLGNRLHFVIPRIEPPSRTITRSVYTFWLQILVVGSLLTGVLLLPVFYYISIVRNTVEMWIGILSFYIVIFLVFISFLLPWSLLMLGGVNPISWMIHHVTYNTTRSYLIIYWSFIVLSSLGVVVWKNCTNQAPQSRTIVRKYFHLLAIAVFLPGIVLEPSLTHLAASVAVAAFVFLEYVRMSRVAPLGEPLHHSLQVFLDDKDTGSVVLSHIYLLIGCALPLWLYPGNLTSIHKNDCSLVIYSGVLSIGVGDTLASIVGKKVGRHKWPGSAKSLEGTAAGIIAQMICIAVLRQTGLISIARWVPIILSIVASSLLEAWTTQIDNLILPPFLLSLFLTSCS